jgi:hypothetical protein
MASSTVTSGHGVNASVLSTIGGLGPKRFAPGKRRRLSRRQDNAQNVAIINPNLFRKRLTWQCPSRASHPTKPSAKHGQTNQAVNIDPLHQMPGLKFDSHNIRVDTLLTDGGTEFYGAHDRHEYELHLAVENIDHTRIKVKNPQTNGICERFHKTMLYLGAFRKKLYETLEAFQEDLDEWLTRYNEQRTYQDAGASAKPRCRPCSTALSGRAKSRTCPAPLEQAHVTASIRRTPTTPDR